MQQGAQQAAAAGAAEKAAAAAQQAAEAAQKVFADKIAQQSDAGVAAELSRQQLALKREEIKNQLQELTEHRRELQSQMDQMNPVSARGHQARIAVIDQRAAQLEKQLFAVNDQLASLPADADLAVGQDGGLGTGTEQRDEIMSEIRSSVDDAVFGAVATSVFSLLGIWVLWRGFRRFIWKRKPAAVTDNAVQLAQLQQSMDAMAIEIERISEAQRFSAKLLNDRVLSQGEAQPVGAGQREPVGARKRS